MKFENTSSRQIRAIWFGFVSFDVWDECLGKLNGHYLDAVEAGGKAKRDP